MAETQSTITTTNTEATAPTGDIKIFIDAFNKDFDVEIKQLVDAQQNYKNVYADAIKISTPKSGPWPNDPKVVTIGDLFKYTFPDIESDKVVQPPEYSIGDSPEGDKWENLKGWEKDLKYSKDEKIKKMYQTISSGINSNLKIQFFQDLKKPGITNPSLWSPGQYYFDVFMMKFFVNRSTKPSSFLKDPYQSITDDKGNVIEPGKEDFVEFTDAIYSLSSLIVSITNINIGFTEKEDKSSLFPSLQTQYKSGLWSELVPEKNLLDTFYKDKEFDSRRGDFDSGQPKTFIGYYEHILLYKAFIQAGDNYKSVVLPLRNPEPEPVDAPVTVLAKVVAPTAVGEVQFKFNVEKKDTFIVVGGTVSPPLEFIIVPNDGTTYIIETPDDIDIFNTLDDIDDEYEETEFGSTEEEKIAIQALYSFANIDNLDIPEVTKRKAKEYKEKLDNADDGDNNSVTTAQLKNAGGSQDFWTLVAICSKEDGDKQAWCDIAQTIYNRVGSGAYGANNITTAVTSKSQYEPTWSFPRKGTKNVPNAEWKKILDINSAAVATGQSVSRLKEVAEALKNKTLQDESKRFVGGRTDFLGLGQPAKAMTNNGSKIQRTSRNNQIGYSFNYKGKVSYSRPKIVDTISIA